MEFKRDREIALHSVGKAQMSVFFYVSYKKQQYQKKSILEFELIEQNLSRSDKKLAHELNISHQSV